MTNPQSSDPAGPRKAEKEGWPLWGIVLIGTLLSFTVGYFLAAALARLVAGRGSWWKLWTVRLDSAQWYDVLRSDIAAVGLAAAGGAAFLAYRRQRTSEGQHRLERQCHDLTERVDFRDRYAKAAEQLGHDKPAVRLAGVYAMAQLADDWVRIKDREQQQVCIDVPCAYFRMPTTRERTDPANPPRWTMNGWPARLTHCDPDEAHPEGVGARWDALGPQLLVRHTGVARPASRGARVFRAGGWPS